MPVERSDGDSLSRQKAALRRLARARRIATARARPEAPAAVARLGHAALVTALARAATGRTEPPVLAGYWPVGSELDIRPLLVGLGADGVTCALPCVVGAGRPLLFRRWAPGDRLIIGDHGIAAPMSAAPSLRPTVLLVPLLAFDRAGARLGQGGGYYDRTLAALRASGPAVLAVGVGFDTQAWDHLPVGPCDQRLDALLTDRDGFRPVTADPAAAAVEV